MQVKYISSSIKNTCLLLRRWMCSNWHKSWAGRAEDASINTCSPENCSLILAHMSYRWGCFCSLRRQEVRQACLPPYPPLPPQHTNMASQTRLLWVTEELSFTALGFLSRLVLSRQMCLLLPNLFLSNAPIILAYQSNLSQMLITTKPTLWLPRGSCDLNMRHWSCLMTSLPPNVHLWYAKKCSKGTPKIWSSVLRQNPWWKTGASFL